MHRPIKTRQDNKSARGRGKWRKTLIGAVSALGLALAPMPTFAAQQVNDDTLLDVYHLLLEDHYTHPDENLLLQAAVKGMLDSLQDPFTNYMSAEEYQDFINAVNQSYAGIGVTLVIDDKTNSLLIDSVIKGGPADKAGLRANDKITEIDGVKLTADTIDSASDKIRGAAGTTVVIGVERDGQTLSFTLTREDLQLPETGTADLGNGIQYIRIYSFGENTASEFEQDLADAQKAGAKGLVLDLRDNGGGLVQEALTIADDLLKKGTILIVHQDGGPLSLEADDAGTDLPVTVLINENTASASEMLAGALQKNGRAKLVGVQSYGKGTMQQAFDLPNGSEVKISVDNWLLPDGSNLNKVGLEPDVHMSRPDAAVNAAMQLLLPDRAETLAMSRGKGTGVLNGSIDLTDVPSIVAKNGKVFVPLRYVFESFGTEVRWDPEGQIVALDANGKSVKVDMKHKKMTVNGASVSAADWFIAANGNLVVSTDVVQAITGKAPSVSADQVTVYSK